MNKKSLLLGLVTTAFISMPLAAFAQPPGPPGPGPGPGGPPGPGATPTNSTTVTNSNSGTQNQGKRNGNTHTNANTGNQGFANGNSVANKTNSLNGNSLDNKSNVGNKANVGNTNISNLHVGLASVDPVELKSQVTGHPALNMSGGSGSGSRAVNMSNSGNIDRITGIGNVGVNSGIGSSMVQNNSVAVSYTH